MFVNASFEEDNLFAVFLELNLCCIFFQEGNFVIGNHLNGDITDIVFHGEYRDGNVNEVTGA